MLALPVIEYLHALFAFVFVGAVLAAHWNTLAARRSSNWAERAALLELNRRLAIVFSLPSLIGSGIVGNLLAMQLGFRMGASRPLQIVTGLWLLMLIVSLAIDVPLSARLATLARAAAKESGGGVPAEWAGAMGRWRAGNGVQLLLFLVTLWFMVAAWKP
jgi:hypothetical protein